MSNLTLKFCNDSSKHAGAYKLLELTPELSKLVESSPNHAALMSIKGQSNEDAVLCTADKTYTLRSVTLSNSVLVVTPSSTSEADVVIRDQLHEILEPIPCLPRLHKLNGLLRGREYDEGHEEDEDEVVQEDTGRPAKKRRLTYEDAKDMLQASDAELEKGLREKRILLLKGCLRPIALSHLHAILELLLNTLVALSLSHTSAPVEDLLAALEDEHEINRDVTRQVMRWFGEINDEDRWRMDVPSTVREVGLGILRAYKNEPIPEDQFFQKWRTAVGDTFESIADLGLLSGDYLSHPSVTSPISTLVYFPASALPSDPASRFADLFLTRPRWKADEIAPFLADIVVDNKDRDKLLLKYARAVTDSEGVWYTARAKLQ